MVWRKFNPFILLVLITLLLLPSVIPKPVYGIVKRNDEYVPSSGARVNNTALINYLETLRGLNDTTVNSYVDRIEAALSRGDIDEANRLLSELQDYLNKNYSNGTGREDLDKALAFVSSVEEVGSNETTIDLLKYTVTASKLLNDPSLKDLALKLGSGKLSGEDVEYLEKILGTAINLKPSRSTSLSELAGGSKLLPNINKPEFNPPQFAPIPSAPTVSSPSVSTAYIELIMYLILLGAIGYFLYRYRMYFTGYFNPLKRGLTRNLYRAALRLKRIKDPVAQLYYNWLVTAKSYGYRRAPWETPREFLGRIGDEALRRIGSFITRLYEEKFYGGREPPREDVDKANRLLRGGV